MSVKWIKGIKDLIADKESFVTWGFVTEAGVMVDGEVVAELGDIQGSQTIKPFTYVEVTVQNGRVWDFKPAGMEQEEVSFNCDRRGFIVTSQNASGPNNRTLVDGYGTYTVKAPQSFMDKKWNDPIYIPGCDVTSRFTLPDDGQNHIVVGVVKGNRIYTYGGAVLRMDTFSTSLSDQMVCVVRNGQLVENLEAYMLTDTVTVECTSENIDIPGTQLKAAINNAVLGIDYRIQIPTQVMKYQGNAIYHPYKVNGEQCFQSDYDRERQEIGSKKGSGFDPLWIQEAAKKLSEDVEVCRQLNPILASVLNTLPPSIVNSTNPLVAAIQLAGSLTGAYELEVERKPNDNALPSNIL